MTKPINPLDCGTLQDAYERGRAEMQAEVDALWEKDRQWQTGWLEGREMLTKLQDEAARARSRWSHYKQRYNGAKRRAETAETRIAQLETALRQARDALCEWALLASEATYELKRALPQLAVAGPAHDRAIRTIDAALDPGD